MVYSCWFDSVWITVAPIENLFILICVRHSIIIYLFIFHIGGLPLPPEFCWGVKFVGLAILFARSPSFCRAMRGTGTVLSLILFSPILFNDIIFIVYCVQVNIAIKFTVNIKGKNRSLTENVPVSIEFYLRFHCAQHSTKSIQVTTDIVAPSVLTEFSSYSSHMKLIQRTKYGFPLSCGLH